MDKQYQQIFFCRNALEPKRLKIPDNIIAIISNEEVIKAAIQGLGIPDEYLQIVKLQEKVFSPFEGFFWVC